MKPALNLDNIWWATFVRLLVPRAPGQDKVAQVSTLVRDLCIVAHLLGRWMVVVREWKVTLIHEKRFA